MNYFSKPISYLWILILVLVAGAGGILAYNNYKNMERTYTSATENKPLAPPPQVATATVPTTSAPKPKATTPLEFGFWVWGSPYYLSDTQIKSLVKKIKSYGGNTLYITIDDYLSINQEKDAATKKKDEGDFVNGLDRILRIAHAEGLVVDAESGERDWVNPENRSSAWTLLDFLKTFNEKHPNKFRNFQYDVEPYLTPEYQQNQQVVLTNYLRFIDETVTNMGTTSLGFSVVIPYFYDGTFTSPLNYNGTTAQAYSHLLNILDRRAHSSLIIMAYRNFTEGTDSAIQISESEVNEASLVPHTTKIIIAQETGNVQPSYTTFYGKSKKDLLAQISTIKNYFGNKKAFAGVAVDHADAFLKLQD